MASAGDGGTVILWRRLAEKPTSGRSGNLEELEGEENEEYWQPICLHRTGDGSSDLYDIAWHPSLPFLVVASTDNSAHFLQYQEGVGLKLVKVVKDHQHFCQGVAWDPWGQFVASASCDRSFKILLTTEAVSNSSNNNQPKLNVNALGKVKGGEDESVLSFFRRLAFTPDGGHLLLPAFLEGGSGQKGIGVLHRNALNRPNATEMIPLPPSSKPVIAIRPHPQLFTSDAPSCYRCVYAAVALDTLYIFDTRQHPQPLYVITGLHFGQLTDAAWSPDGLKLFVSATDGFCSTVNFLPEDFCSEPLSWEEQAEVLANRKDLASQALAKRPQKPARKKTVLPLENKENNSEVGAVSSELSVSERLDHVRLGSEPQQQQLQQVPVKRKVTLISNLDSNLDSNLIGDLNKQSS